MLCTSYPSPCPNPAPHPALPGHEATAAELAPARLRCGKVCHRALPGCPHTCQRECHEGACTSAACAAEVTLRCACKRIKRKAGCQEVQRLLLAATGSAAYDGATSLRLLPCDAACTAGAAEAAAPAAAPKASRSLPASKEPVAGGEAGGTAAAAEAAAAASQEAQQPKRKLSREERQRQAEERQRQKEAAERRKFMIRAALLSTVMLVVLLVALLLALGGRWLLAYFDARAQEAWGRPEL